MFASTTVLTALAKLLFIAAVSATGGLFDAGPENTKTPATCEFRRFASRSICVFANSFIIGKFSLYKSCVCFINSTRRSVASVCISNRAALATSALSFVALMLFI